MKINRTWMVGAFVLAGTGLTSLAAMSATAEDMADGAATPAELLSAYHEVIASN